MKALRIGIIIVISVLSGNADAAWWQQQNVSTNWQALAQWRLISGDGSLGYPTTGDRITINQSSNSIYVTTNSVFGETNTANSSSWSGSSTQIEIWTNTSLTHVEDSELIWSGTGDAGLVGPGKFINEGVWNHNNSSAFVMGTNAVLENRGTFVEQESTTNAIRFLSNSRFINHTNGTYELAQSLFFLSYETSEGGTFENFGTIDLNENPVTFLSTNGVGPTLVLHPSSRIVSTVIGSNELGTLYYDQDLELAGTVLLEFPYTPTNPSLTLIESSGTLSGYLTVENSNYMARVGSSGEILLENRPSNSVPALAQTEISGNTLSLTLSNLVTGGFYAIEQTTNLLAPAWTTLTHLTATNDAMTWASPLTNSHAFYRVIFH